VTKIGEHLLGTRHQTMALCAHFVIDSRRCCLCMKFDKSMGALADAFES
jgi:hypothetical protein